MPPESDAPHCSFWLCLAAVALVVAWAISHLGARDIPLCEGCPGHREPANACLCYHVPLTPDSLPH